MPFIIILCRFGLLYSWKKAFELQTLHPETGCKQFPQLQQRRTFQRTLYLLFPFTALPLYRFFLL
jgi:hypothetical protein